MSRRPLREERGGERPERSNSLTPPPPTGGGKQGIFSHRRRPLLQARASSFIFGGEPLLPVLPSFKGIAKGLRVQCAGHAPTATCSSLHK